VDHTTELVPHDVVTETVAHRDQAVALFEQYFAAVERARELLEQAEGALTRATQGKGLPYVSRHATEVVEFHAAIEQRDMTRCQRVARRLVDLAVWGALVELTELRTLMDRTAKEDLATQMAYVPEDVDRKSGQVINQEEIDRALPPVTVDNVMATLEQFREDAGTIWRRGIATAFSRLDRRFRSHDGFKVGGRIILTRAFNEWGGWNHWAREQDTLVDIERVFLVLDGRHPSQAFGIVGTIDADRRHDGSGGFSPRQSVHEGNYFRVRVFKNGNAHLWFTRDDLVEKVNKLLAEYYGAGLGWGKAEQEQPGAAFEGAVERAPARNYGLFPTPDALAEKVVNEANLYSETPLRILEPSAGTGQLASRAAKPVPWGWRENATEVQHRVDVVEVQPELVRGLEGGPYARVLCREFLAMAPEPVYDRVVMNPPFDRLRDVDHVHHALRFLRPGGRLVAIMSQSAEFSEQRKAVAFRAEVEAWGGTWRDLPEGSFRKLGTNVNTCLLTVDRPKEG
jgi:hypothetical protein